MPEDSPHISLLCPRCQQERCRRMPAVVGELVGPDQSSQRVGCGAATSPAGLLERPEHLQVRPGFIGDEDEARLLGAAAGFGFLQAVDERAARVGAGGGDAALTLGEAEQVSGTSGGEEGQREPSGAEGAQGGPVAGAVVAAIGVGSGGGGQAGALGAAAGHELGELGRCVDQRIGGFNGELLDGAEVDGDREAADIVGPGEHHLDGGDDVVEGAGLVALGEVGAQRHEHFGVEVLGHEGAEGVEEVGELLAVVRDGDGLAALGLDVLEPELGEVGYGERAGAGREAASLAGLLPGHPGRLQVGEVGGAAGLGIDREVTVLAAPVGEPDAGGVEFEGGGAHGTSMQCATDVGNCQKKLGRRKRRKWLVGRGLGGVGKNAGRGPIRCRVWWKCLFDSVLGVILPSEKLGSELVAAVRS